MRQTSRRPLDPGPGISIATLARDYPRQFHIATHSHQSDQLVYATRGIMRVFSDQSLWVIPPHFGLWVPALTPHEIRMSEPVSMRTLYLRPGISGLRPKCAVLHVRPLLLDLIIEAVAIGKLRARHRIEGALCLLLIAELQRASPVPVSASLPRDPRARTVAEMFVENPGLRLGLTVACDRAGVSIRTLERVFRREVGTSFESWRRQMRLMKAIEMLVAGRKVKDAALSVGYQQPGAFVALFRRTLGMTPKVWVSGLGKK
jgi:AraC-like DNA-binding protein